MRKILIINPNSSDGMTEEIEKSVAECGLGDILADVVKMPESPEALESYSDYALAAHHMTEFLRKNPEKIREYAGVLIACYGDPGLYAVKEMLDVPVIGIAEASMSVASLLGYKFSIVAAVPKARAMMIQLVESYGLSGRLASVESLDLDILTFMRDDRRLEESFLKCARSAREKGADTVIYGCAGMTKLQRLIKDCGIGVIDPVTAGVFQLKALIEGDFRVSKSGIFM